MGESRKCTIDQELLKLCDYLAMVAAGSKDRIETYKELEENEYIPTEIYNRLMLNEKLGMLDELNNYIQMYGGRN